METLQTLQFVTDVSSRVRGRFQTLLWGGYRHTVYSDVVSPPRRVLVSINPYIANIDYTITWQPGIDPAG